MHIFRTNAFQTTIVLVFGSLLLYSSPGWAPPASKEVTVINDSSSPVPIEDVDHPARQPFRSLASITNIQPGIIATVPSDSRLVIEFLTASCNSTGGIEPTLFQVFAGILHSFSIGNTPFGTGFSSVATHLTRMYAEPNSDVIATVFPSTSSPTITCDIAITGHLVAL